MAMYRDVSGNKQLSGDVQGVDSGGELWSLCSGCRALCPSPSSGQENSFQAAGGSVASCQPLAAIPLGTALAEENHLHPMSDLHERDRSLVPLGQL